MKNFKGMDGFDYFGFLTNARRGAMRSKTQWVIYRDLDWWPGPQKVQFWEITKAHSLSKKFCTMICFSKNEQLMSALAGWKGLVRMICFSKNEDRAKLFTQWMDFRYFLKMVLKSWDLRNFASATSFYEMHHMLHLRPNLQKTQKIFLEKRFWM